MNHNTEFTSVEHQLLHALSAGQCNKRIAQHLGKSEFTVRNQLVGLFKKIKVNNRTQAASWYLEHMAGHAKLDSGGNGTSVLLRALWVRGRIGHGIGFEVRESWLNKRELLL